MQSRWNETTANQLNNDLLKLRVFTSRLLGAEGDLVLHGGGNTSVKIIETNLFGEPEELLYVKGSGWDLATIEAEGFAPVRLDVLKKMATLPSLTDSEMVRLQRAAMTNPNAPTPSVEAVLHAIIPFTFVDHTHADAVVTITNSPGGEQRIREIYGERMLIVPYLMPGFILAKAIFEQTRGVDWSQVEGMILMNHGVFTFDDDAQASYEKMIDIVTKAEEYLVENGAAPTELKLEGNFKLPPNFTEQSAAIRQAVSKAWGKPVLARHDHSETSVAFSNLPNVADIATRGCLTPDHSISTKPIPAILSDDPATDIEKFKQNYAAYFQANTNGNLTMLDPAPRWAIVPGHGTLSFGTTLKATQIVQDINQHTMKAIQQAEKLGGWQPLSLKDLFEVEYWELEQAKLKKGGTPPPLQGKIALVTGAASGIGKACVERLLAAGAVVAALDINPEIAAVFNKKREVLPIECDVTDSAALRSAVEQTVAHFGGLDLLISNAGIFTKSMEIKDMDEALWQQSLSVNLTSHQQLLQFCLPFLSLGIEPAVVFIGSKNVPAPGMGAGAYSVAKAGLTQLARIAALELGKKGIRVNVLHPNAVYDTGIWTDEVLQTRAAHYGQTVEQYKTSNVLKVEVTSKDVAELAVLMLGSAFAKVTGAQLAVDGGNERII